MNRNLQPFGKWLIIIGLLGFFAGIILSFTALADLDHGALPAGSFLIIMLGLVFNFPSLLEESPNQLSTMRIIVFAIVMVFCVIYLKIGWSLNNLEQLSIDKNWIYILGLAFGSKVFQKFGEQSTSEKAEEHEVTPEGGKKDTKVDKVTEPPKTNG